MRCIYEKRGVVLGNGPSCKDFAGQGDIVVGCNKPASWDHLDAVVITDPEIIQALVDRREAIPRPAIVSKQVYERILQLRYSPSCGIIEIFQTKDWHSSGHYAAMHLLNQGCTHIDLWGCDSQTTGVTTSLTDDLMTPNTEFNFAKKWKEVWNQMISGQPDVVFTFHQPSN